MNYFRLVWLGLWRKPVRTLLTLLSVCAAFLLFGLLQGIDTSFSQLVDTGRLNMLVTMNPAGLPLPLADLPEIASVPAVTAVSYRAQLIGYYQSMRNIVIALPVDPGFFEVNRPMFTLPPQQLAALQHTRTGAVITPTLAQRLHWKVGDQVPFHSISGPKKDGSPDWVFNIVGIFDIPDNPAREQALLLFNYDYFDASRATDRGTVQVYMERIADPTQAAQISNAIDNLFANSSSPTHTDTERANAQAQLAQLGDLDFFVDMIVGATFVALLMLTGNTLMQAFRERIREFAVMKALGFTDGSITALVLSEALLLCVGAALLGLAAARALLPLVSRATGGQMPGLHLPGVVFALGLAVAVLLALCSALAPAWRAKRLSITRALVWQ